MRTSACIHATVALLVAVVLGTPSIAGSTPEAGSLDPTFGVEGKVMGTFGGDGNAIAIQPNARIVVAGSGVVTRYLSDGSLDTSFGTDGFVSFNGDAHALALQPDHRIVVAGDSEDGVALARYDAHGDPDPTFGSDGTLVSTLAAGATAVGIQSDGKIVVTGEDSTSWDFAVLRFGADGRPDRSFGHDSKVRTEFTGMAFPEALVIDGDDRIIVAGGAANRYFALARYRPGGRLDPSFGDEGTVKTTFGPEGIRAGAYAVLVRPNGKVVAAGFAGGNLVKFALARYRRDGSLDLSFGRDGEVVTNFGRGAEVALGIAIQTDGKVIAAGFTRRRHEFYGQRFALARYETDGSLDSGFGGDGMVTTNWAGPDAEGRSVAIQADGRIVVCGLVEGLDFHESALARYLP